MEPAYCVAGPPASGVAGAAAVSVIIGCGSRGLRGCGRLPVVISMCSCHTPVAAVAATIAASAAGRDAETGAEGSGPGASPGFGPDEHPASRSSTTPTLPL